MIGGLLLIGGYLQSRFKTSGIKSYPIPSTIYPVTSVSLRLGGRARIDPNGSTPITFTFGRYFFKHFAVPVMVPPVPAPPMKTSILPFVCSRSSRAVP